MQERSGLSFVEVMGCMVALCGGVAIGALYLGVDLNKIAYGVVKQSNLVDPTLIGLKGPTPDEDAEEAADQAAEEECISDVPMKATELLADEIKAAIEEDANLQVSGEEAEPAIVETVELTDDDRVSATQKCWNSFVECVRNELKGRTHKIDQENWQLLQYLTLRKKGHEQAIETINDLDRTGVDARLLQHIDEVLAWHESGLELYSHAENLLTNGPNPQLTGPFAQSWQSSATQLGMEERLVRNKHNVILGYLNHTYPEAAPFSSLHDR